MTDDRPHAQDEPGQERRDSTAGTAIGTTVPHSARIWNYWLGGKDNYAVDREAGDQYKEIFPGIAVVARTSRAFLTRAVRYLATEAGIRQFLDVGAVPYYLRSPAQFTRYFQGLELVEPGVVPVPHWRPDPDSAQVEIYSYCGVGRKP